MAECGTVEKDYKIRKHLIINMKYIPYGRQSIDEDDIREVVKVLKSDWLTQGDTVRKFEEALARYCGVKYAVAVSSGTAALHLACLASGLKKGDEAITSPITFLATPNSIIYAGAKPVFADIDYDTVNINSEEIKKNITKKTKAILPVHFAGLPCNMPEISKIAEKHNLIVIEDACHALGAEYKADGKWIKVGSCRHSDMTAFSFHPVKHITTGEGGAITTNNKKIYEKLKILRNHGIDKNKIVIKKRPWYYEMRNLGFNYRITDFQCALGISQLKKIRGFINRRVKIADTYSNFFKNIKGLETPFDVNNFKSSWHIYILKINYEYFKLSRQKLMDVLKKQGIATQVHYIPVYRQPFYKKFTFDLRDYPNAENYYKRALTVPIYPKMTDRDADRVMISLKKALKNGTR
jgi:perosamine synthetase